MTLTQLIVLASILLCITASNAQTLGTFTDGYEAGTKDIGINIVHVHDGPACRERKNCSWMLLWSSRRNVESAEISVFVAGKGEPAKKLTVPGKRDSRLESHNPIFDIPLATVSAVEFKLYNGTKKVGAARFPITGKGK